MSVWFCVVAESTETAEEVWYGPFKSRDKARAQLDAWRKLDSGGWTYSVRGLRPPAMWERDAPASEVF